MNDDWRKLSQLLMAEAMSNVSASSSSSNSSSIFTNFPLISDVPAFALAQSIKVFTTWGKYMQFKDFLHTIIHSRTYTIQVGGIILISLGRSKEWTYNKDRNSTQWHKLGI